MKKLLVIGIIAMMITGLSVAANAFAGTVLSLEPIFDGGSFQQVFVGWYTDKGDGAASLDTYDLSDLGSSLVAMPGQLRFDLGTISGAPGDLGTPNADFKAPNLAAAQVNAKRWVVSAKIETNPDHVGGPFGIKATFNPGFGPTGSEFYIFAGSVSLANCKLWSADPAKYVAKMGVGSTGWSSSATQWAMAAPASGTVWDDSLNDGEGGEATTWGTNPVQSFTVYAQWAPAGVPEPGSMLAMLSGLVGLVGFGIRRRK